MRYLSDSPGEKTESRKGRSQSYGVNLQTFQVDRHDYDQTQTNWKTINQVLEGEKVTAANLKDSPIDYVPLVLESK